MTGPELAGRLAPQRGPIQDVIRISFHECERGLPELAVEDNGIGLSSELLSGPCGYALVCASRESSPASSMGRCNTSRASARGSCCDSHCAPTCLLWVRGLHEVHQCDYSAGTPRSLPHQRVS